MVGNGEEHGQLAVALDDALGSFKAKRKQDGRYEISVTAVAAEGKFNTTFPPFERMASLVGDGKSPPFITFSVLREFLARPLNAVA